MYLYNDNFIVTYFLLIFEYVSEQKILTVEDLRRNVLSKNVFSIVWLPYTYIYIYIYIYIYREREREREIDR